MPASLEVLENLAKLGVPVPTEIRPQGRYALVLVHQGQALVSGQVPRLDNAGALLKGCLEGDDDLYEARAAARLCLARALRALHQELGDLAHVDRLISLKGFVNAAPNFQRHGEVLDAASDSPSHCSEKRVAMPCRPSGFRVCPAAPWSRSNSRRRSANAALHACHHCAQNFSMRDVYVKGRTEAMSDRIAKIEAIVGQHVRRDISRLVDFAKGNLGRAAESIATTAVPHVGIVVGFFVRHALPPSPETDGLNGMAHLAAGFAAAGFRVTVITDAPCAKAVWAVIDVLPTRIELEIVDVSESAVRRLRRYLKGDQAPLTHLIAIERAAPGSDGKPHREHGWDMSRETAPLHLLFHEAGWKRPWTTIGIGDGGNEIGMGSLPIDIVKEDIPNGPLIGAQTPSDHLIVAGVSNWGAYGLLASVACLRPDLAPALLGHFDRDKERHFLQAAVNVGQAIDDSRVDRPGSPQMSVDRIPIEQHADLIDQIRALVPSSTSVAST